MAVDIDVHYITERFGLIMIIVVGEVRRTLTTSELHRWNNNRPTASAPRIPPPAVCPFSGFRRRVQPGREPSQYDLCLCRGILQLVDLL